jgi:branched-chain amino acid transport system substrate-binding protein
MHQASTARRRSRPTLRRRIALGTVGLLALTGCGSQHSYDELLQAQRGGAPLPVAAAATTQDTTATGATGAGAAPAPAGTVAGPATAGAPLPVASSGAAPQRTPIASNGKENGKAPAGVAATAPKVCTGSLPQITIGSVGVQSGLLGSIIGTGVRGVQAWVAQVNAAGGLNCHPVKYIVADDGADPARHQALVQQLVERDKVIAFVQMNAVLTGQSSVDYLNKHQVPAIGAEGGSGWFYTSLMHFPQSAQGIPTLDSVILAGAKVAKQKGLTKVGVVACIEASVCSQGYDRAPDAVKKLGLTLAYRSQASLSQPDFTAICQSAKSAGVEVFDIYMDGNSVQRMLQSCGNVGFKPVFLIQSLGLTPTLPQDDRAQGAYGAVVVYPWTLTNLPAVVAYQTALRQFLPGTPSDSGSLQGWVSAKIFEAAAAKMPDQPTSAAVLEGLWSIKKDTFGGLTNPITFTKGRTAPHVYCWWLVVVKDKAYTSPDGGERQCTTF